MGERMIPAVEAAGGRETSSRDDREGRWSVGRQHTRRIADMLEGTEIAIWSEKREGWTNRIAIRKLTPQVYTNASTGKGTCGGGVGT